MARGAVVIRRSTGRQDRIELIKPAAVRVAVKVSVAVLQNLGHDLDWCGDEIGRSQ